MAMGRHYTPKHPRYAPHDAIFAVSAFKIAKLQLTNAKAIEGIRQQSHEGLGCLYDADLLVVPEAA